MWNGAGVSFLRGREGRRGERSFDLLSLPGDSRPSIFQLKPLCLHHPNSPSRGPCLKPQKTGSLYGFSSCRETKPQTNVFL